MLRNIVGALVFTVAVLALINFIGDMMVNPATAPHQPRPLRAEVVTPAAETPAQEAAQEEAAPAEEAPAPAATEAEAAPTPPPAQEATQEAAQEMAAAVTGDAAKGASTFKGKCMSCHTAGKGEPDRTGPNLWGIVGRARASSEGFRYSTTMKAMGGTWSEADINSFIAGPRTFVPDTKMTFAGLKKAEDRANVIAYLKTLKD